MIRSQGKVEPEFSFRNNFGFTLVLEKNIDRECPKYKIIDYFSSRVGNYKDYHTNNTGQKRFQNMLRVPCFP